MAENDLVLNYNLLMEEQNRQESIRPRQATGYTEVEPSWKKWLKVGLVLAIIGIVIFIILKFVI